ncbi:MAG: hypothetical protein J6X55_11615, partial [Victivallales bacterium]|nr:hypothetical protein [Victivallales bacterium]
HWPPRLTTGGLGALPLGGRRSLRHSETGVKALHHACPPAARVSYGFLTGKSQAVTKNSRGAAKEI